tara:strand:+ start:99 stop:395 length:297 start_codon:yes stop_codon:yes gene_type:complete
MKVLVLAVVMLFVFIPAYAEENRGVLKGAGAELVLLYGEILHTGCKYGDMITARCNFVVRVQGNTAASKSIYHCEFVNHDGVKDIDITCYTKGLDDPD